MRRVILRILFVVAFVSIGGMFLFKFKYEQMKRIVEGAGLEAVDNYLHSSLLSSVRLAIPSTSDYEIPLASWNNVSDYFVYSAFRCSERRQHAKQHFCAIGLGPLPDILRHKLECGVVFDLGKEVLSVPGSLSLIQTPIEGTSSALTIFKCVLNDLRSFHRKPFAYLLRTVDRRRQIAVPIFKGAKSGQSPRYVLCVRPSSPFETDWEGMIEFFAYHDAAGITDVIAYDHGVNFFFLNKIKYLIQTTSGSLKSLSVVRWDFPFGSVSSDVLVETDCLRRTSGSANLTVNLKWNQFVVPGNGKKIDSVARQLADSDGTKFNFPSKRCCTDAFDDRRSEKAWPTILRKTLCIPDVEPRIDVRVNTTIDDDVTSDSAAARSTESAEILSFATCQGLGLSELVPVFSVWKLSHNILSSNFLRFWKDSDLFSMSTDV